MKIISETNLRNFQFWSGAIDQAKEFTNEELDQIEAEWECAYPDGMTDTEINDMFWFEPEQLHEMVGHRAYRVTLWNDRYVDLRVVDDDDLEKILQRDYPYTVVEVERIDYDGSLELWDDFDMSEFAYPSKNRIWDGDIPEYAIGALERGADDEELVDLSEEDVKNIREFLDKIEKLAEGHDWYIVYEQEDWEGGASFSHYPEFGLPTTCIHSYIYKRVIE